MYVIRRHSRKLFFPAGLLALAWLPVLGGALLAARPEMRKFREQVMPVSLPPLQSRLSVSYGQLLRQQPLSAYSTQLYLAPASLLTPLPTVPFSGNPWQNYLSIRTATFVAHQLAAEPNANRGLRLEFGPDSHYKEFVAVLDLLRTVGPPRYWLDTRGLPISLNAFTVYHPPSNAVEVDFGCFLCNDVIEYIPPTPPPPTWYQQLRAELAAAFQLSTWRPLFSPDWRYSTLLLLLLPLAAAWQLRRLRTTDFRR